MKIPTKFKLFGTTINIVWDNVQMNRGEKYGQADYSKCEIVLSDTHGVEKLSEDRIMDTFYHEKVHIILDTMQERELSNNERFVDTFAKLWRQSDLTAEYDGVNP